MRRYVRDMSNNRPALLAAGVVGAAAAAVAAILAYEGRGITFTGDEWAYVAHVFTHSGVGGLLSSPGSDYLLLVPLFLYERLLDLFGMTSYVPFRVAAIATHLAVAALLFALLRRRIGPVAAALAVIPILFLAGGPPPGNAVDSVTMTARRLPMLLAIAFSLGALLALDRRSRRGDIAACALLTLGTLSHPVAVAFVVVAAVTVLARDGSARVRSAFVFAVPALVWVAAALAFGNGASDLGPGRLIEAAGYVARSFAAAAASLLGILNSPPVNGADAIRVGTRWLAAAAVVAAVVWAVRRRSRQAAGVPWGLVAAAAGLVVLLVATALQPGSGAIGPPDASRYVYPEAVLLVLVVAEAFRGIRLPRRLLVAAVPLLAFVAVAGTLQLREVGSELRTTSELERAELGALQRAAAAQREIAGPVSTVTAATYAETASIPELKKLPRRLTLGGVPASVLEEIGDRYGSPALDASEIASAPPRARQLAATLYGRLLEPTSSFHLVARALGLDPGGRLIGDDLGVGDKLRLAAKAILDVDRLVLPVRPEQPE